MTLLSGRVHRLFADDRCFWTMSAFFFGMLAFLKGFRRPNDWSATQAQVDYRFGLVKRGLFGAALTGPLHLNHMGRFAAFSIVVLLLLMALLVAFVVKSGVMGRVGCGEVVAMFFASYCVTYLAHTVGYFDILEAVMAVAVLMIRSASWRLALAVPVCLAAVMVHELFLVVFVPVLAFSFVFQGLVETNRKLRMRRFVEGGVVSGVALVTTLYVALQSSLSAAQVTLLRDGIAATTDFGVRQDFFAVMTRSAVDNLAVMGTFYRSGPWLQEQMLALALFLPTLVLLLMAIRRVVRGVEEVPVKAFYLAVAAGLSPFGMYVLGWDGERWQGLAVLTAFLTLLTVCTLTRGGAPVTLSAAYRNATIFVMALSMGSGGMLMDRVQPRLFPFGGHTGRGIGALSGVRSGKAMVGSDVSCGIRSREI